MTAPSSTTEFLDLIRKSGLAGEQHLQPILTNKSLLQADTKSTAEALVRTGVLTRFQAKCLLCGRYKGLVLGRYKILDQIGQGGMGAVYLAQHLDLNRKVAIKVLTDLNAQERLATDRFLREARSAAALDHPNIVRVFDFGHMKSIQYIVMEFVEGQTLRVLVEKVGPLHYAQAADYIAQAAAGLQHAFEKGLIHRDIKPDNLILDKTGTVKILDLGLARLSGDSGDNLTQNIEPNATLGTPDYIAPEQAINSSQVDIRADIYSLGATFFVLVTGRPPFTGNTAQKLTQHQLKDPVPIHKVQPNVPRQLSDIVTKMMAKKPEDRYQTPAELVEALTPWLFADDRPAAVVGSATGLPAALSSTTLTPRSGIKRPAKPSTGGWLRTRPRWQLFTAGGVAAAGLAVLAAWAVSGGDAKSGGPGPAVADASRSGPPPAPVAPTTKQTRAPAGGRMLYQLDLAGVEPFKLTMQEKNATDVHAPGQLPTPWKADIHKPASFKGAPTAEFVVEMLEGAKVFSIRNVEGTFGQFYTGRSLGPMSPQSTYMFRIEYQTLGRAHGELGVRGGISGLLPTSRFALHDTAGAWQTAEFVLNPSRDMPMFVFIQNHDAGPENQLIVRAFSVTEQ